MRAHHLNCISTCPLGGQLMDGQLACHCLLVEAGNQLVLLDTGFGLDCEHPSWTPGLRFCTTSSACAR